MSRIYFCHSVEVSSILGVKFKNLFVHILSVFCVQIFLRKTCKNIC